MPSYKSNSKKNSKEAKSSISKRVLIVYIFFFFAILSLIGRLGWIQLVEGDELHRQAQKQWSRETSLEAERGEILDRNENPLVSNVTEKEIAARPEVIKSPETIAKELETVIDKEKEEIEKALSSDSSYVRLATKTTKGTSDQREKFKKIRSLPGILSESKIKRYYPHEKLASQVIGYVGEEESWSGLERKYERELSGNEGWSGVQTAADMTQIPHGKEQLLPPKNGKSLITTLDLNLQFVMEKQLEKVLEERNADRALALAMDPNTGEILAMGSKPNFHPADFNNYEGSLRRNPLVESSFEPGSTFKILPLAASIEENQFDPEETFFSSGSTQVAGTTITCWSGGNDEWITFREVVYESSNPGFVEIGQNLEKENMLRYIEGFGLGSKTGIDLPAEAEGQLFTKEQMGPVELATTSFGQGISVTPIQQAVAVSAVANGGYLVEPYIGSKYINEDGNKKEINNKRIIRQVISEKTSQKVTDILEGVVEEGTGENAKIEGYRVAGKTGTAQKPSPEGGYLDNEYISSFIGFAPAEDPEILVYVAVDIPREGLPWGGEVAAPVFKEIAKEALRK